MELHSTLSQCLMSAIVWIIIDSNNLGGQIPCEIENLDLDIVNARNNQFRGDLSRYFCNNKGEKGYTSFWADCYGTDRNEALVECPCCTVCCDREVCCGADNCCHIGGNINSNRTCVYDYGHPLTMNMTTPSN